jgi:hypothetical protein
MQTELINLTALAKINRGTTPATRTKLEKLGVKPVQEVQMPGSGRKFVLFDKVKAVKALEKSRAEREKALQKAQEVKKPAAKPAEPAPVQSAAEMAKELQEMRKMMAQMLEHMTQPARDANKPQAGEATTEKQ